MKIAQWTKAGLQRWLARHDLFYLYLRIFRCALIQGPGEARRRYREYVNVHHSHGYRGHLLSSQEAVAQRSARFRAEPIISIVVPLYNTPMKYLRAMVRSVQAQTYEKWELCLTDGSDASWRKAERFCRRLARREKRIHYQRLKENLGISVNSNAALEMATGEYIGLLDHDDLLHPSALFEVLRAIEAEGAEMVYTDEAIFRKTPKDVNRFQFKPDFSPDTLRGINYICHFTVFHRDLLARAGGGFRPEYDGSQDYDLFLRLTEKANRVTHVPRELYYWRDHAGSVAMDVAEKPYTLEAGKGALRDHLQRMGLRGEVMDADFPSAYRIRYQLQGNPKISIIIPNMDHGEDLKKCLSSIQQKSTWQNWEAIIVENNSRKAETFQLYEEITGADPRVRVVKWGREFNFSALCNFGASSATGEYILLLNNDMEVISPQWMEEMLMYAQRPDVGAVGGLLYYPDDTVQHAGVIVGLGAAAGHAYRWYPRGQKQGVHRLCIAQNLSAVTGACMMIPRRVYDEVQGMEEAFPVAFNDVDLCLRIRAAGYLVVFTPFAELYHYESKSRGSDENGRNKERFEAEAAKFRAKWSGIYDQGDPYYNVNLTRRREDFSIRDEDEA
ncbi:MAG: glycosyltransferase family 2 protein [Clostridia bacterium]|nr:glycosyltransferase family 2 protein [Clostridia bacterium]